MKKLIAVTSLIFLLILTSCSEKTNESENNQKNITNDNMFDYGILEKNLQGVTEFIIDNNGMTYNITENENLESKPYYAAAVYSSKMKEYDVSSFSDSDAIEYVILNKELLAEKWHNLGAFVSDGKVYLDISLALPKKCKDEIIEMGAQYNDRMIYDLENHENLPVGQNQENEYKDESDIVNDLLELQRLGCLD